MKTESVFLGDHGLSSSEANHIANVTKELSINIGREIESVSLFEKTITDKKGTYPYNFINPIPENFEKMFFTEGELYALSAWLREGIKAKDQMMESIRKSSLGSLGFERYPQPVLKPVLSLPEEQDMIEHLTIAERAEYLKYESLAAHLGKKIHKNGLLDSWKMKISDSKPYYAEVFGQEHATIQCKVLIPLETIQKLSLDLQKEWREYESKVNYYKAKLNNLYNDEVSRINTANAMIHSENSKLIQNEISTNQIIYNQYEAKKAELIKEISGKKIIIPHTLQSTLDFILAFAKK